MDSERHSTFGTISPNNIISRGTDEARASRTSLVFDVFETFAERIVVIIIVYRRRTRCKR